MLSPPDGLPEEALLDALAYGWAVQAVALDYRPVGFGSHHWAVVDTEGARWFLTVDELEIKRRSIDDPLDAVFGRLGASLAVAGRLREHGHQFVVAPVSTLDGEPLARIADQFGVALYPFVAGRSFGWGEFSGPEHRQAMLELIVAVHTAPAEVRRLAMVDDFVIPHRDELEAALDRAGEVGDFGPYARPAASLLAEHAKDIRRLFARFDDLAVAGRADPARMVLTHGEPHPGNTMWTDGGWLLIDWDTALVAPPERDLWGLDPGDGSVFAAYADATGVTLRPAMLDLFRLRWDLADLAVDTSRFLRPHSGNLDDVKSWDILRSLFTAIGAAG